MLQLFCRRKNFTWLITLLYSFYGNLLLPPILTKKSGSFRKTSIFAQEKAFLRKITTLSAFYSKFAVNWWWELLTDCEQHSRWPTLSRSWLKDVFLWAKLCIIKPKWRFEAPSELFLNFEIKKHLTSWAGVLDRVVLVFCPFRASQ